MFDKNYEMNFVLSITLICWLSLIAPFVTFVTSAAMVTNPGNKNGCPTVTTTVEELDEIVNDMINSKAKEWRELPTNQKTDLLKQVLENTRQHADEWIQSSVDARMGQGRGDAILLSTAIWSNYITSLISVIDNRKKVNHHSRVPLTTNKFAVKVYPDPFSLEQTEAIGMRGELVINEDLYEKSQQRDETKDNDDDYDEGVSYVMGAGNVNAPIEILCELFLHNRVCIYKPNPVNDITFVTLEEKILQPFIQAGYISIVYDDHQQHTIGKKLLTEYIKQHDKITKVVLTGAESTYKNIVMPNLTCKTKVCAELGAVNAWIIVPSKKQWNKHTINDYARHLAFAKTCNNGHTCAAPQIYILPRNWKWRNAFQERLKYWLSIHAQQEGTTPPFYPNSFHSQKTFQQAYSQSEYIFPRNIENTEKETLLSSPKKQMTLFIPDCTVSDPNDDNSLIFQKEAFSPVLAEVPLDFDGTDDDGMKFLNQALNFTQKNVHGSLTMTIIAPDSFLKQNKSPINELLANMPYGAVGVNVWSGMMYSLPKLLWGAYPGASASGEGFIGNIYQYKGVEKAILRANFHNLPRRFAWVRNSRTHNKVLERFGRYTLRPNIITQLMLFSAILLGI